MSKNGHGSCSPRTCSLPGEATSYTRDYSYDKRSEEEEDPMGEGETLPRASRRAEGWAEVPQEGGRPLLEEKMVLCDHLAGEL